jgi:nucleoside-triphosphatase
VRIARSARREVKRKILLTGRPGCGKTTLIKRVVKELALPAGGFYTEEMRERGGRVGFKIITLQGKEAVLAHVDFKTAQRVGKYGLDLSGLETIGVEALRTGMRTRRLVVVDEIGPMELRSRIFRDAVSEALDSGAPILATISARSFPFTNALKRRRDVTVIEVRASNREQLVAELSDQFRV